MAAVQKISLCLWFDGERAEASTMQAMLAMKKIDIGKMRAAYEGR